MAALTASLLALSAAGTANSFIGQRRQAKGIEAQGDYEAQLYGMNADALDDQAADALARGKETAGRMRGRSKQLTGAQRASFAAQGLDLSTGSPADVIENDAAMGELDALTVVNNARRDAHGFATQSGIARWQGETTRTAARNQAKGMRNQSVGTLLAGAGELLNIYSAYGMNKGAPKSKGSGDYGTGIYGPRGMFG